MRRMRSRMRTGPRAPPMNHRQIDSQTRMGVNPAPPRERVIPAVDVASATRA